MRFTRHSFIGLALALGILLVAALWTTAQEQSTPAVPPFIGLTETHILDAATQDAITASAATEVMATRIHTTPDWPLFPLDMTATAIIQRATDEAPPTEVPLTNAEKEELQRRWVSELETAFGFSHPIFDYIARELIDFPGRSLGRDRLEDFRPHIDIQSVDFEDSHYIAGIVSVWPDAFLLFRVKPDGDVVLLSDPFPSDLYVFEFSHEFPQPFANSEADAGGFADRNQNGYPDLLFWGYTGGNGCYSTSRLFWEIQPGGDVVDLSANWIRGGVWEMGDVNGDDLVDFGVFVRDHDVPNILAGTYCHNIGVTHWYGWNGTQYADITTTLDESQYPLMTEFWNDEANQAGCLLPGLRSNNIMLNLLLDYEALGRLEEGWARLAPMLRWEDCPAQTLIGQGEAMGAFLTWVGEHRRDQPRN
ncbi:MAG: hypothetical protein H6672_20160 [Anaerolineaceae bacterium]|nr:hypothetical protein [Anaerolineaceae bacterium]